ncbi:MAG: acetylglutamate kinase [Desulfovibrio sp.]|nr:acetylglutamate kinase [Desulfovibrio sp.]
MEENKIAVIKFGGHAMDIPELRSAFFADLAELAGAGYKFVLVHGGGPRINALLKNLNIESKFVRGLRVTDSETLTAVEMALCGQANKELVRELSKTGLNAAGISGEDGRTLIASPLDAELGRVGKIGKVNRELIECLIDGGFLPVVAPVALDESGEVLNVNADTAAGAIASALNAGHFILVSDVPGALDQDGRLFSYLSKSAIDDLIAKGVIHGGMLPKVDACLRARENGCETAFILDGRKPGSLKNYLLNAEMAGTEIDL